MRPRGARCPCTWAGEFIGAFIGAVLVYLHYYPHWGETEDADLKLAVYSTGPAIRTPLWNIVSEVIGTFVLVFVILALRRPGSNKAGLASLGPLPVAFLVLVIGLSLGGTTGYAINPARDLSPADRALHPADPGQARLRLGLLVDPGHRAAPRRGPRCPRLLPDVHELHADHRDLRQRDLHEGKQEACTWRTTSEPLIRARPAPAS